MDCSLVLTTLSGVTVKVSLSVAKFDRFENLEDQVMDYLVSVTDLKVLGRSIDFLQTATQTYPEDPIGEVMDSLRQQNPQLLRFIPGAFLHPQFQSTVIIAKVRMGQELTMRKFVARSIKLCVPIRVCNDYGCFRLNLVNERTGRPAVPSLPSEDPVNPHFHIRSILGPHWHWTLIYNGFRSLILCGSTLLESNRGLFSQKFSFTGDEPSENPWNPGSLLSPVHEPTDDTDRNTRLSGSSLDNFRKARSTDTHCSSY